MQTFLPYKDFKKSAECLDYRRLGKQRVEAWQIYQTLIKSKNLPPNHKLIAWENHPIVKMWKGYEYALLIYGIIICEEWINRGYNDNMKKRFINELKNFHNTKKIKLPSWLGNKKFHNSHKSNLLRKDSCFYKKYDWDVKDNYQYIWVV